MLSLARSFVLLRWRIQTTRALYASALALDRCSFFYFLVYLLSFLFHFSVSYFFFLLCIHRTLIDKVKLFFTRPCHVTNATVELAQLCARILTTHMQIRRREKCQHAAGLKSPLWITREFGAPSDTESVRNNIMPQTWPRIPERHQETKEASIPSNPIESNVIFSICHSTVGSLLSMVTAFAFIISRARLINHSIVYFSPSLLIPLCY